MKISAFLPALMVVSIFPSTASASGNPCGKWSSCTANGKTTVVFQVPGKSTARPVTVPEGSGRRPVVRSVAVPQAHVAPAAARPSPNSAAPIHKVSSGPSAAEQFADSMDEQTSLVCSVVPGMPCQNFTAVDAAAHAAMLIPSGVKSAGRAGVVAPVVAQPVVAAPPPKVTPVQAAQQAWTTQPFAAAHVSVQPVGNVTLTGLPTFFQARFPGAGLAPGEQISATVLGQSVTIRPASAQFTYDFGDGATFGPTPDAGGPYPSGHVTHTYEKPAIVNVRIDVVLTGEFQVAGGGWQPIPGSTTVRGVSQRLEVAIMQSRLDSDDGTNTTP